MTDPVRQQYETYPYPARNPADEAKRLIEGSPSHLLEIDHYVYGGRRDFTRPFRALVAGGGTGDATIMLAQHLADRGCPAEVVYLDLSTAARRIAEARAGARKLANIRFLTGSLTELPTLGLGRFDYIDCCGVLHHLEDPPKGLRSLADALAEDGGLGLMVYGALGRTGVYPLQEILRQIAPPSEPAPARIDLARRLLKQIPTTNWFARNPALGDHLAGGDAGLFDLLLHDRDRAYTVPELCGLVASAGLEIAGFIEPWRYDPASYLADARLLKRLSGLDPLGRAALAEQLAGNLKRHVVYLVRAGRAGLARARPESGDAVPVLRGREAVELAKTLRPGVPVTARIDGLSVSFPLPRRAGPILARVDGRRSLAEIHRSLAEQEGGRLDWAAFKAEFDPVYAVFNGLNLLFLTASGPLAPSNR